MLDRLIADAIVTLHLLFIVFAVIGGVFVLRWRRVMWLHLPAVAWAVLVELMHWPCPLTRWENLFRERYGASGYSGGFLDHYLIPIIYPDGLTDAIQVAIGLFVFTVNMAVYGVLVFRTVRRRRGGAGAIAVAPARPAGA
jgi:hypothetical protein